MALKRFTRYMLLFLLTLAIVLALILRFGPREPIHFDQVQMQIDFGDGLDAYLQTEEAKTPDIVAGLEKQIVWANPATKAQTDLAVVYVHGFSASLEETRPLPDKVAEALGANLFFTRLTGHGREQTDTSIGLAEAQVHDWLQDVVEAIRIGERIGQKVVLMSASTGSTLLTWALAQPELSDKVAANIFVSPNFGVVHKSGALFDLPWARSWLTKLTGERRIWAPDSEEEAKYWTFNYPAEALIVMGASVRLANRQNFEAMQTPSLFVYSEKDAVVKHELIEKVAKRWGTKNGIETKSVIVNNSTDENNHVIAGDVKSPNTTESLAAESLAFIKFVTQRP